jgi:NodT family efflux transporter outer membrane factor (OMF) lipoprotein
MVGCGLATLPHAQDSLKINTPEVWQVAGNKSNQQISQGWLTEFNDSRLRSTVLEAQQSNQNLQATAARLRVAKELTIQSRAELLPTFRVGASGGLTNQDSQTSERSGLSLAASWEPDLWGRLRDLNRAVAADFDAAVAEFRNARLSLAATTAKSYCNLISAQQQLVLAQTTLDSFEKNLRIIERNYKAGVPNVRALDVQLGRTNVSAAQRTVKSRELERDDAARSLEVLLGRYPSTTLQPGKELPVLNRRIPAGLPATLIERRPDLESARARIMATAQRASAARKNLLPNLSLTGSSSSSQGDFARLLSPTDLVTNITLNLTQILYAGGALEAEARLAVERNKAAIHDYAQAALEAFREVESALGAESSLAAQEGFLEKEVEQAALAERQAERDYSEGIEGVDILSVLESQRRANNARSSLIRLKNERLQNRIDLHLALGGSF